MAITLSLSPHTTSGLSFPFMSSDSKTSDPPDLPLSCMTAHLCHSILLDDTTSSSPDSPDPINHGLISNMMGILRSTWWRIAPVFQQCVSPACPVNPGRCDQSAEPLLERVHCRCTVLAVRAPLWCHEWRWHVSETGWSQHIVPLLLLFFCLPATAEHVKVLLTQKLVTAVLQQ